MSEFEILTNVAKDAIRDCYIRMIPHWWKD